ncbi:Tetratricopeptide TPR_1 repeat-containing protein [Thalassoporum mexicanum PCC 7367]|uniref:tetratricopeptide repeat protein n=1 Tax=Thalassoporum mexicanum TaxID=3457544 RepID=UPI00029F9D79|nr:tetratricopeptide repeat protein [Pseudanabaena sp. PCC 7367]AFY71265.1 Tetratricopeptide TPR_1 repeat-containing protein [Pseudanabaena sp. PCC 7367]
MDIQGTPPSEPQLLTLQDLNLRMQLSELPVVAQDHMQQQRWPEAILCYHKLLEVLAQFEAFGQAQAISENSNSADVDRPDKNEVPPQEILSNACCGLGVALSKLGQLDEAIASYEQALAANPEDLSALYLLGVAYSRQNQWDSAIASYQKVLNLQSAHIPARMNLGVAFLRSSNLKQAVREFEQLVTIAPNSSDAHCNLGIAHHRLGELETAAASLETAIALEPSHMQALYNRGKVAEDQDQPEAAIGYYRQALSIEPDDIDTCCSLAFVLDRQNQSTEAIALYQHAISLNPHEADALSNLGASLVHQRNPQQAIDYFERALSVQKNHLAANLNLAHACFMLGNFARGFEYYKWRWFMINQPKRDLPAPLWDGSPLAGKTVLVSGEQGVGDEVLFGSMIPDVIAASDRCWIECQPRLVPLFARSFPEATIIPKEGQEALTIEKPENIDFVLPMGSMGQWLRPTIESFTDRNGAFMQPDAAKVQACRDRYLKLASSQEPENLKEVSQESSSDQPVNVQVSDQTKPNRNLIVGISWHSTNRKKYPAPLADWLPILNLPGITFVDLQYGDWADELAQMQDRYDVDIYHDPNIDQIASIDDFAAQVAAVDLVISISNTAVHMAGALGKPLWLLLPYVPEPWYWLLEGTTTPWYASASLFRQRQWGDWDGVFDRVANALSELVALYQGHPGHLGKDLEDSAELDLEQNLEQIKAIAEQAELATNQEATKPGQKGNPANLAQRYLQRAQTSLQRGRFTEAIDNCQKLIALELEQTEFQAEMAKAYTIWGRALQQMGKPIDATKPYEQAIALQPDLVFAHWFLGQSYDQQGLPELALSQYIEALTIEPETFTAESHFLLGNSLVERHRYDQALEFYQRAIELKPGYLDAHRNRIKALALQGNLAAAVQAQTDLVAADPDLLSAKECNELGMHCIQAEKLAEAIHCFENAIQIDPENADAHFNLGNTFAQRNQVRDAIICYQEAIAIDPNFAQIYFNLGVLLLPSEKQLADAIDFLRAAIDLKPEWAEAHQKLGEGLYDLSQQTNSPKYLAEAIASFKTATRLKPSLTVAHQALELATSTQQALPRMAPRIDPDDPD